MANEHKPTPLALNTTQITQVHGARSASTGSTVSDDSSLKAPRTPRFVEATAIHSPIDGGPNPFSDRNAADSAHPGNVGFGYITDSTAADSYYGPKSPLKSAMKVPGTPARKFDNPLSPTFREEQILEKREQSTEKEQAKDLVSAR